MTDYTKMAEEEIRETYFDGFSDTEWERLRHHHRFTYDDLITERAARLRLEDRAEKYLGEIERIPAEKKAEREKAIRECAHRTENRRTLCDDQAQQAERQHKREKTYAYIVASEQLEELRKQILSLLTDTKEEG